MNQLALVVAVCVVLQCPSIDALQVPPAYTLDLDKAPEDRWTEAVHLVTSKFGWDATIEPLLHSASLYLKYVPKAYLPRLDKILLTKYPSYYRELRGIHAAVNALKVGTNVSWDSFMISPFVYELVHSNLFGQVRQDPRACTGILSLPADTTQPILHGRNDDAYPHQARNATLTITVKRGGKTLYSAVDSNWVLAALFTTSRINGINLEQNEKLLAKGEVITIEEMVSKLEANSTRITAFLFRDIQDAMMDFDAAKTYLNTVDLAAPSFIVMSGTQRRGALLSLCYNKTDNREKLLHDGSNETFLVLTNYDWWLPDPKDDPRRTVGEATMREIGRNRSGTDLGVWMALSTYPVHNQQTLFSVLMRVDRAPEGYVRMAMNPKPDE